MAGFQQIIIVGNVGRDPEMKFFPDGNSVCNFSVAVTRRSTDRTTQERKEETTWFRVNCWRQLAEIANQYVRKGTQVMIVGRLKARAYLDQSGQPQVSLDIEADQMQLLGSRADSSAEGSYAPDPGSTNLKDIPF
ncbi:MAG: single-stranded DNA-binding protein [Candidatus Flexifilum sp.]|jgi:single-strand DNA-binding protein